MYVVLAAGDAIPTTAAFLLPDNPVLGKIVESSEVGWQPPIPTIILVLLCH